MVFTLTHTSDLEIQSYGNFETRRSKDVIKSDVKRCVLHSLLHVKRCTAHETVHVLINMSKYMCRAANFTSVSLKLLLFDQQAQYFSSNANILKEQEQ